MLLGAIYEAWTWAWPSVVVVDVDGVEGMRSSEGSSVDTVGVERAKFLSPYVLGAMAVGFMSLGGICGQRLKRTT